MGSRRVGGQIDLRPNPVEAFKAATKSIALNEGQKKKKSQRQKEKDNKNKKKAGKGKSGDGGATSGQPGSAAAAAAAGGEGIDLPFKLGARADQSMDRDQRVAMVEAQLTAHGIDFQTKEHAATPTVDELVETLGELAASDGGALCKNLFLKAEFRLVDEAKPLGFGLIFHD